MVSPASRPAQSMLNSPTPHSGLSGFPIFLPLRRQRHRAALWLDRSVIHFGLDHPVVRIGLRWCLLSASAVMVLLSRSHSMRRSSASAWMRLRRKRRRDAVMPQTPPPCRCRRGADAAAM